MDVLPGGQAASKEALTSRPGGRTTRARRRRPPPPRPARPQSIGDPGSSDQPLTSATAERRNERERNRVKLVNLGFAHLRRHVPLAHGASKKMNKVETLRSAVEYIRELESLLGGRRAGPEGSRAASDGLSPHGSSSVDSPPRSPTSCASSTGEASRDSSTGAEYLSTHSWG